MKQAKISSKPVNEALVKLVYNLDLFSAWILKMVTVPECDRPYLLSISSMISSFWFAEATARLQISPFWSLLGIICYYPKKNGSYV